MPVEPNQTGRVLVRRGRVHYRLIEKIGEDGTGVGKGDNEKASHTLETRRPW